jgi:hypothetical protein
MKLLDNLSEFLTFLDLIQIKDSIKSNTPSENKSRVYYEEKILHLLSNQFQYFLRRLNAISEIQLEEIRDELIRRYRSIDIKALTEKELKSYWKRLHKKYGEEEENNENEKEEKAKKIKLRGGNLFLRTFTIKNTEKKD